MGNQLESAGQAGRAVVPQASSQHSFCFGILADIEILCQALMRNLHMSLVEHVTSNHGAVLSVLRL